MLSSSCTQHASVEASEFVLNAIKLCTHHACVEASEFVLNAIKLLHTTCWC